jgi:ankyrin repeat protein
LLAKLQPGCQVRLACYNQKLPQRNIIVDSKYDQANRFPSTSLTVQPNQDATASASSLSLVPPSYVFQASSKESITFFQEMGIWKANIQDPWLGISLGRGLPVFCEQQKDLEHSLHSLPTTGSKHRMHILDRSGGKCVFVGSLGLKGGMQGEEASLHEAVKTENLELVEKLLASGADPNSVDKDGLPPLENATWQGCFAIAQLLLAHGANPNQPTKFNQSYLYIATMKNYVELVKLFLANGADVNVQAEVTNRTCTPLEIAITMGYIPLVQLLLENGAKPNRSTENGYTPLHLAVEKGCIEIVQLLLENDPELNINMTDQDDGFTALNLAAKQEQVAVASLLLDKGADPNIAIKDGFTPLHWAADNGQLELVYLLLEKNANLDHATKHEGFTPLHLAVDQEHVAVAKLLLDKRADPNMAIQNGATPLHWAAHNGNLELVNPLLAKGAAMNKTDHESWTPLHFASNHGHLAVILRLLLDKPNLNSQTNHGETFLHILVDNSRVTTKRCLDILQGVMRCIENTQHAALNNLLGVIEDCCPALTNHDTKNILAMMVDYVEGLDLSLKNQGDSTVLDILQIQLEEETEVAYQVADEVLKTLKRHQKLGGWLTPHRQKRVVRESAISNDPAISQSAFKRPRHE